MLHFGLTWPRKALCIKVFATYSSIVDKNISNVYNIRMPLDKIPFKDKVKAVKTYLTARKSLRRIAQEIDIPYQTLWFWVKQYKTGGSEALREGKAHS